MLLQKKYKIFCIIKSDLRKIVSIYLYENIEIIVSGINKINLIKLVK